MDIIPAPVQRVLDAINAGDSDAFEAAFTEDGVVDDWGRRFEGRDAVRGWSDREAIGAGAQMTPTDVDRDEDVTTVEATWSSSVFNGSSSFVFTVADDLVTEMRIPPH